jgi:integrase
MAEGIQKIFSQEGKDLLRKILSETIKGDMNHKQQRLALKEAENDGRLKKFIIGWRIRPRIVEDGKRIQTCETLKTFEDAKKRLREIANQVEKKEFTRPGKIPTVSQACDTWLKDMKKSASRDGGKRSDSTIDFYENIIENHIKPEIGHLKMDEVTKGIAISTRDKWTETLGISVNKVLMVVRSIYNMHNDIVSKNPFRKEQVGNVPREDGRKPDEAIEVDPEKVFSRAEVATLLHYAVNDQDRMMLRITAEAGLRDGELLGLTLDNVLPIEKGKVLNEIRIVQQWRCRNEYDPVTGVPSLKPLKTPKGCRTIKISQALAKELAKWKREHAKNPFGLMFVNSVGRPCHRKNLSTAMDKAIAAAKKDHITLKDLEFYSLRDHFASVLIQRMKDGKVSDLEIAYLMGHKDTIITRKTYAKFLKSESTYNPEIFGEEVQPIKPPLAEMEPESDLVN